MFGFKRKTPYEKDMDKLHKMYPNELSHQYITELANIQFKYGMIDEYEKSKRCVKAMAHDWTVEHIEEELLKIELKYGKIDELEYEKRFNDLKKNPWAKVRFNYDESVDASNIQTEVIYNEYFIKKLQKMGYSGETEDDMVESWLSQVFASNISVGDYVEMDEEHHIERTKVNDVFIVG